MPAAANISLCKFTPLGFETGFGELLAHIKSQSVNLPRWGLKLPKNPRKKISLKCVNLPRWGLKHLR